jgi:hypothetical protein
MATTKLKTEPTVILELSGKEAQTLVDVLALSSGYPMSTRRKYADSILNAMNVAGYRFDMRAYSSGEIVGKVVFEKGENE